MSNESGRLLLTNLLSDYPGEMRTWGETPDEEAIAEARAILAIHSDASTQRARAEAAEAEVARLGRVLSDRKGALESVTPERVRAYLTEHGWTMHKAVTLGTGFPVEFWQHAKSPDVMLVLTTDAADYAARMADVARRCGVVEERDPVFVIAEWLSGDVRP